MALPMPELIKCVAEARDPTVVELLDVASRIWVETAAERSVFAWKQLPRLSDDRAQAIRLALTALCGSDRASSFDPDRIEPT